MKDQIVKAGAAISFLLAIIWFSQQKFHPPFEYHHTDGSISSLGLMGMFGVPIVVATGLDVLCDKLGIK